jgi:hypothetical protein
MVCIRVLNECDDGCVEFSSFHGNVLVVVYTPFVLLNNICSDMY